ncbi:MAG TPA: CHAP domain-containing protein, partial [Polyangiaceae bacterium]
SNGGHAFDSSCTGNGGLPEYWCADFARWVWENQGAGNTSELNAAAGSFYVYGQNHGTLKNTPAVGDAVVFDWHGDGTADHVALVSQVNSNGTIETVSGDWNGQSGSEATFSSTSHVVLNSPAYPGTVGSSPGVMGMTISGFISPVGLNVPYSAAFVSQSFPYASTAITMFAGQTLSESLVLKNGGTSGWDSKTRIGTTQPRDRASKFTDGSWIADNRLDGVSGTVAPGGSYTFKFDFHAPSTPGTYLEYFGVVQEGVAWFSDPGQGGPPDNDLEAQIVVVPGVRGNLDAADCTAITGWTQDQASAATATAVDLYFDAPSGQKGAGSMRVTANVNRPDLCTAIGSCSHGFSVAPPAALRDGKAHTVYGYGVANADEGPTEELGGGSKTFTCAPEAPTLTPPGGIKRHVVSTTSFTAWSFNALQVAPETAAVVASYADGADLPASPTVVKTASAPEVWVIDGKTRRHVVDGASLAAWGFPITTWTDAQVSAVAQGADWPGTPFLLQGTGDPAIYVLDVAPTTPPGSTSGDGGTSGTHGQPVGGGTGDTDGGSSWTASNAASGGGGGGCSAASGATPGGAGWAAGLAMSVLVLRSRRRRGASRREP